MYCEYCGKQLEEGALFCSECGYPVNRTKVTFPIYDNATMPVGTTMPSGDSGTRVYAPQQMSAANEKKNKKIKSLKSQSKKRFKKKIIAVIAAMIILVGSVGGYFIWRSMRNSKDEAYFKPFSYEDIEFPESGDAYIKNELILTGSESSSFKKIKKLAEEMTGEIVGYVSMSNDYQIEFKDEKNRDELDEIIDEWSDNDLVASVDYHYVYETDGSVFDYSNDEWWNYQDGDKPDDFEEDWEIYAPYGNNWGVESVWMPKVWEMDQDFKPVKVGIIDTMFDMSHPDLDKKFKKVENNPESIEYDVATGTDGESTDSNTTLGDANATAAGSDTFLYHGTHVAGIIGATIDNGVGIAGVAQNAELYGYSMAASDGTLYTSIMEWKAAIGMQLLDGCKAINISMDMVLSNKIDELNNELVDFLQECIDKKYDFLLIKAADNKNGSGFITEITDKKVRDHIIVVGGAEYVYDNSGSLIGYELINTKPAEAIDIFAPGVEVDSDVPGGLTENHDGTSVAAPFVTGEAALIWGVNEKFSSEEVKNLILENYIYEVEFTGSDSTTIKRPYANAYMALDEAVQTVDKDHESESIPTSTDAKIEISDQDHLEAKLKELINEKGYAGIGTFNGHVVGDGSSWTKADYGYSDTGIISAQIGSIISEGSKDLLVIYLDSEQNLCTYLATCQSGDVVELGDIQNRRNELGAYSSGVVSPDDLLELEGDFPSTMGFIDYSILRKEDGNYLAIELYDDVMGKNRSIALTPEYLYRTRVLVYKLSDSGITPHLNIYISGTPSYDGKYQINDASGGVDYQSFLEDAERENLIEHGYDSGGYSIEEMFGMYNEAVASVGFPELGYDSENEMLGETLKDNYLTRISWDNDADLANGDDHANLTIEDNTLQFSPSITWWRDGSATNNNQEEANVENGDWKQAYIDFLNGFVLNEAVYSGDLLDCYSNFDYLEDPNQDWSFDNDCPSYVVPKNEKDFKPFLLGYVDDDDIPELILNCNYGVSIVSYVDGEIKYSDYIETKYGGGFHEKTGIVYGVTGGTGVARYSIYDYSKGDMVMDSYGGYIWVTNDKNNQYYYWSDDASDYDYDITDPEGGKKHIVTESEYKEKENQLQNADGNVTLHYVVGGFENGMTKEEIIQELLR
ncbi:MAG: S8 family serine peptidase [Eubacterium sp.]|nr:S8 family serine peptidase [Eubacterium sp.]